MIGAKNVSILIAFSVGIRFFQTFFEKRGPKRGVMFYMPYERNNDFWFFHKLFFEFLRFFCSKRTLHCVYAYRKFLLVCRVS